MKMVSFQYKHKELVRKLKTQSVERLFRVVQIRVGKALVPKALDSALVPQCLSTESSVP